MLLWAKSHITTQSFLFRMKKKCSLDSTCSEDSMYEHCPGPEILLHRDDFLIYNKKVPPTQTYFHPTALHKIDISFNNLSHPSKKVFFLSCQTIPWRANRLLQVSLRSLSTDAASERKTSTEDPAFPSPQLPRCCR